MPQKGGGLRGLGGGALGEFRSRPAGMHRTSGSPSNGLRSFGWLPSLPRMAEVTGEDCSEEDVEGVPVRGEVPTTRWSLVRAMGADATVRQEALEDFAREYWPAVYAFVRKKGHDPADSEDLTQSFLSWLIERETFEGLSPDRGRFRSWLLACLHNFLRRDWRDQSRKKRAGGKVHVSLDHELGEGWLERAGVDEVTPEVAFDRRWAAGILQRALNDLAKFYEKEGKLQWAQVLAPMIAGADERQTYADAAEQLGISESNARVAAFRMRKRLRTLVREEVALTVGSPEEVDAELRELFALFSG